MHWIKKKKNVLGVWYFLLIWGHIGENRSKSTVMELRGGFTCAAGLLWCCSVPPVKEPCVGSPGFECFRYLDLSRSRAAQRATSLKNHRLLWERVPSGLPPDLGTARRAVACGCSHPRSSVGLPLVWVPPRGTGSHGAFWCFPISAWVMNTQTYRGVQIHVRKQLFYCVWKKNESP